MVESNSPSSSATRSAELAGASLGAPLPAGGEPAGLLAPPWAVAGVPPLGWPPPDCPLLDDGEALAGEPLEALLGALLAEEALELLEALLEDELLAELVEELEEELLAVFCSSEKSTSSGGSPSLFDEGSGGIRDSSLRSDSEYTGVDWLRLSAVGSEALLDERERWLDSSPLSDAVLACWLERSPDSILGIDVFGCELLLAVDILGLRLLGELCDGELLAVDGLDCDWLELDDCDWDCDCDCDGDDELDDGCCGCAGGCCWVC